jgi:hypothetical protein
MTESARRALLLTALLLLPVSASAQTLAEDQASEDGEQADALGSGSGAAVVTVDSGHSLSDEQAVLEEDEPAVAPDDGIDPTEHENTDYFSAGAIFRGIIIPDFMQRLFVDYRGGTPINAGMGAYFNWRRNGFNVIAEVWYAGFQNEGYYHGLGADDTEMEQIQSHLGAVFGNFVFGWAFTVTNWFAIELGLGLGFGGMVGNMYRQEAYPSGGGYAACTGPGAPNPSYCEPTLETRNPDTGRLDGTRVHGGTYQQNGGANNGPSPFYFGDGGVPPMFFWIDLPRIGLRFRPIRQIQIRLDGGYNLYGFNFGGSIGYGF